MNKRQYATKLGKRLVHKHLGAKWLFEVKPISYIWNNEPAYVVAFEELESNYNYYGTKTVETHKARRIVLNQHYLQILSIKDIENLILHEIAHAILDERYQRLYGKDFLDYQNIPVYQMDTEYLSSVMHNEEWTEVAKSLGCDANPTKDFTEDQEAQMKVYRSKRNRARHSIFFEF